MTDFLRLFKVYALQICLWKEEKQILENGTEVNQVEEKKFERSNQDEVVSKRPFDEMLESQVTKGVELKPS